MDLRRIARAASRAQGLRELQRQRGTAGGNQLWSTEEDALVRRLFPDYRALMAALPRRSYDALRARVRALGLTKTRHVWTGAEITRLRRLYPTASRATLLAAFPSLRFNQIKGKASHIRLFRARQQLKITPWPTLNAIRDRASELDYTMVDLDEIAGTGRYFQRSGWAWRRPSPTMLARAVTALAGGMVVWWHESATPSDDFAPIPRKRLRSR